MAIFILLDIYCTVRLISIFFRSPPELSLVLSPPRPANWQLALLLDNLDDVFVLHDMCQADPLGAVLGTGSLGGRGREGQQVSEASILCVLKGDNRTTEYHHQKATRVCCFMKSEVGVNCSLLTQTRAYLNWLAKVL